MSGKSSVASNTIFLSIRMVLVMAVSLYTSRVVLSSLGSVNYGVYNVVAGTIAALAFFYSSLSNAVQRVLGISITTQDISSLRQIFSQCLSVLGVFALGLVFIGGIVSYPIISFLNIPNEVKIPALWVFLFNVGLFAFAMIRSAYESVFVIHEDMSTFAYVSVFEVVGRLGIALLITIFPEDSRLWIYGCLLFIIQGVVMGVYIFLSYRKYEECRGNYFVWNKTQVRDIFSFIGFNTLGGLSVAVAFQGITILQNLFFGPVVNAAQGIAAQISGVFNQFSGNVLTAAKPRIIKDYAVGHVEKSLDLAMRISRITFFVLLLGAAPVLLNAQYLLSMWLGTYPKETPLFMSIAIVQALVAIFAQPLWVVANATGVIKNIQVYGRLITMMALPISWLLVKVLPYSYIPLFVLVLAELGYWMYCLQDIHHQVALSRRVYLKSVVTPIGLILALYIPILLALSYSIEEPLFRLFIGSSIAILLGGMLIWFWGLDRQEKSLVQQWITKSRDKLWR